MTLWDGLKGHEPFANADPELAHVSLVWLMLHELHHFEIGHFKLTGGSGLVEAGEAAAFGLVSPSPTAPLLTELPPDIHVYARHCLELQADHDSTEMLLGPWPVPADWPDFRHRLAGIMAMMVLIDREENRRERHDTHPSAAVRIFQTLGHVAELWAVPAKAEAYAQGRDTVSADDLPDSDLIAAWHAEIVMPGLSDATVIARAARADRVVAQLGQADLFFADLAMAQATTDPTEDAFQTEAAKEWARLWPVNGQVMNLLGLEGLDIAVN